MKPTDKAMIKIRRACMGLLLLTTAPAFAQFPDSTTTGVPKGTVLKTGVSRTITVDNTVVDAERISSGHGLTISAKHVTIQNCWITSSFGTGTSVNGTGVISVSAGASVTIIHCRLDGSNLTHAGIWYMGDTLVAKYNNLYGTNDGIFVWDANHFDIEENYLHDFSTVPSNGHIDGFQTEGGSHGTIRHNTFDITQNQNACISIWNSRRSSDDILVDHNLMKGGGFTVYAEDYDPSEASPTGGFSVTNIWFINNVFSKVHYPCVGNWGIWYPRGFPSDGWNRSGNTLLETGQNVDNGEASGCYNEVKDQIAPSTPLNLAANAASTSQINLSWKASTDNKGVRSYKLERCQGTGCTNFSEIALPASITYSNTGLAANTLYRYRVSAIDSCANLSGPSNIAEATTSLTGIIITSETNSVRCFPNPFHSSFHLSISLAIVLRNTTLKIYDTLGKEVTTIPISDHETTIEKTELPDGLYFYTITNNDEKIATGKLIAQ